MRPRPRFDRIWQAAYQVVAASVSEQMGANHDLGFVTRFVNQNSMSQVIPPVAANFGDGSK